MGLAGCGDGVDLVSSAEGDASWSCRSRLSSPASAPFSLSSWAMRRSASAAVCGAGGVSFVAFICAPASSETLAEFGKRCQCGCQGQQLRPQRLATQLLGEARRLLARRSGAQPRHSLPVLFAGVIGRGRRRFRRWRLRGWRHGFAGGDCAGRNSVRALRPAHCGAWISLSKRASSCGCNFRHSISFSRRTASSRVRLGLKCGEPFLVVLALIRGRFPRLAGSAARLRWRRLCWSELRSGFAPLPIAARR